MTLGVWMYFWDSSGWTGGTLPPTPTPPPPESRGGGGNKHQRKKNNDYRTLSEAYWLAREQYLKPKSKESVRPTSTPAGLGEPTFSGDLSPLLNPSNQTEGDDAAKLEAYLAQLAAKTS